MMILVGHLIFIISHIQSYFPPGRTKKILGRFHGIWANIIAALLGTVTPFCSCSSDRGFPHRELFIPQSGFLQTPPHDGRPCLRLTVPTAKSVVDSHHQVIMRAEHTQKSPGAFPELFRFMRITWTRSQRSHGDWHRCTSRGSPPHQWCRPPSVP